MGFISDVRTKLRRIHSFLRRISSAKRIYQARLVSYTENGWFHRLTRQYAHLKCPRSELGLRADKSLRHICTPNGIHIPPRPILILTEAIWTHERICYIPTSVGYYLCGIQEADVPRLPQRFYHFSKTFSDLLINLENVLTTFKTASVATTS